MKNKKENLLDLKKENEKLQKENETLKKQLEISDNLISRLIYQREKAINILWNIENFSDKKEID